MPLKIKRHIITPKHAFQNENKVVMNIIQPNSKASFHYLSKAAQIQGINTNTLAVGDKFTTIFP